MIVKFNRFQVLLGIILATSIYSQSGNIQENGININYDNFDNHLPHGINDIVLNNEYPIVFRQNPVNGGDNGDGVVGLIRQILGDADPLAALRGAIAAGHGIEIMNFVNRILKEEGQINRDGIIINYPDNRMLEEFRNRGNENNHHNEQNNNQGLHNDINRPENNHP